MAEEQYITQKAVKSAKWSTLMEVVANTAAPLTFLILAGLLTPEDFGVVATAMIVITFSQVFWDAGLAKALVQTNALPEQAANVVFWTNLVLGISIYTGIFLLAPWLAVLFQSPGSLWVLRVLALLVIILSLGSVHQALLERCLGFRQLFWVKLITGVVPGLFSIPLALWGYGVWALVAGSLVGSVISTIALWKQSSWRPHFGYDWVLARQLMVFGLWVVGESLAAWFHLWGDGLIVGAFLGVEALGVYRVGWTMSIMIFNLALSPIFPILYPTFSRLQESPAYLHQTFHTANRIVTSIVLPMGFGLLLVAPLVTTVFFGDQWPGLSKTLGILALMNGLSWLVGINSELYRAIGRPDVNTKLMFLAILYHLPGYLLAAPQGLDVFIVTRLALEIATIPIHVYLCVRMIGISPWYLWEDGKSMVLATICMVLAVVGLAWGVAAMAVHLSDIVCIVMMVTVGVAVYGGMLYRLDRPFIVSSLGIIRQAVGI